MVHVYYICNVHVYVYMYIKGKFLYTFAVFFRRVEKTKQSLYSPPKTTPHCGNPHTIPVSLWTSVHFQQDEHWKLLQVLAEVFLILSSFI